MDEMIETDWPTAALGYLATTSYGHAFASANFNHEGVGVPVIRIRDIVPGTIQTYADEQPSQEAWIDDGEVVIGMDGDFNHVLWHGGAAAMNQRVCALQPGPRLDRRYLNYVVSFPLQRINDTVHYTTVKHLSFSDLLAERIPVPPLDEQRRIADYLDTETARIDDLVDMNNRLSAASLERLHRLVVESTLGHPRRPDAQDLGEAFDGAFAPVHTVARVGTGHTPSRNVSEYWQDCDIPWLNIPDLAEARDFWRDEVADTAEHLNAAGLEKSAAVVCPIGTVFVTRTASIGHAAVNAVPMATNQRLVTYYPDSRRLDAHFLLWSIRALKLIGHFDRLTFGATHDTIYYDDMVALRVPLRDLVEQQAAVVAIAELRNEVAALRERLERSSRLLRERRQALIAAAVTGELEV